MTGSRSSSARCPALPRASRTLTRRDASRANNRLNPPAHHTTAAHQVLLMAGPCANSQRQSQMQGSSGGPRRLELTAADSTVGARSAGDVKLVYSSQSQMQGQRQTPATKAIDDPVVAVTSPMRWPKFLIDALEPGWPRSHSKLKDRSFMNVRGGLRLRVGSWKLGGAVCIQPPPRQTTRAQGKHRCGNGRRPHDPFLSPCGTIVDHCCFLHTLLRDHAVTVDGGGCYRNCTATLPFKVSF